MHVNPFYDAGLFLIGDTDTYLGIGPWRYLLLAIFWALAVASVAIAYRNWQADPAQRKLVHFGDWLARVAIGVMWFEGCLWKLPIPSGGFKYWLEQEGKYAAFGFYRDFVTSVLLPSWTIIDVIAFLAEITMASALMLGFGVRAFAIIGMVYTAQLYFGLYQDPTEWPWEYIFIIVINWLFYIHCACRSLGLDALLRRKTKLAEGDGLIARLYRFAS